MINFLDGIDPKLYPTILNGSYVPMTFVPRGPGIVYTTELPARFKPTLGVRWSDEDRAKREKANKAKKFLIMAIPN